MKLFRIINKLSCLARTGWMLRGIPPYIAETVTMHLFTSAIIALKICDELKRKGIVINPIRSAMIALVHDIGEAHTGDMISSISNEMNNIKLSIELEFVEKEIDGETLKDLYKEFIDQKTLEAQIAKLSDYLATYLQSIIYKNLGFDVEGIKRSSLDKAISLSRRTGIYDVVESMVKEFINSA